LLTDGWVFKQGAFQVKMGQGWGLNCHFMVYWYTSLAKCSACNPNTGKECLGFLRGGTCTCNGVASHPGRKAIRLVASGYGKESSLA